MNRWNPAFLSVDATGIWGRTILHCGDYLTHCRTIRVPAPRLLMSGSIPCHCDNQNKSCCQRLACLVTERQTMLVTEQRARCSVYQPGWQRSLQQAFKMQLRAVEARAHCNLAGKWRNQKISPDLLTPFIHTGMPCLWRFTDNVSSALTGNEGFWQPGQRRADLSAPLFQQHLLTSRPYATLRQCSPYFQLFHYYHVCHGDRRSATFDVTTVIVLGAP